MNKEFYDRVNRHLSKKGQHKLANALAHGDELEGIGMIVRLKRDKPGDYIFITIEGDTYKALKCI